MNKELVVLAAGMGSRYGGLKQIDPVGPSGEKIIDYSIYDARRAGFSRVVFVIRKDMEKAFRDAIGRPMESRLDVHYAFQSLEDLPPPRRPPAGREKPWGTGHAVYAARHAVRNPFAVINADDFYGRRAFELLAAHLDKPEEDVPCYAMIGYQLRQTVSSHGTVSRGLCTTDEQDNLIGIEEVTAIEKTDDGIFSRTPDGGRRAHDALTPVSMNCWGFFMSVFEHLEADFQRFLHEQGAHRTSEFYLPGSVGDMIAERVATVKVLTTPDQWYGVTYREDKPLVTAGIKALSEAGHYPAKLW